MVPMRVCLYELANAERKRPMGQRHTAPNVSTDQLRLYSDCICLWNIWPS